MPYVVSSGGGCGLACCGCGVGLLSKAGLAAKAGLSEPPVSVKSANLAATRAVLRAGTGLSGAAEADVEVSASSGLSAVSGGSSGAIVLLSDDDGLCEGRFLSVSRLLANVSAASAGGALASVGARAGKSSTRSGVASANLLWSGHGLSPRQALRPPFY